MGCLPQSGGDERPLVEPFLRHVNELNGTAYAWASSLDQKDRRNPQPEVLCVDEESGKEMVVERKTIVWPKRSVECHKAGHRLLHAVWQGLEDIASDDAFTLETDLHVVRTPRQARAMAREVIDCVGVAWERLEPGEELIVHGKRYAWRFQFRDPMDRDLDETDTGIQFRFRNLPALDEYLEVRDRKGLAAEVRRQFASCEKKFRTHAGRRRVVLVEPFGDISWYAAWWWERFLREIGEHTRPWETWVAQHGTWWEFDEGETWQFEPVQFA